MLEYQTYNNGLNISWFYIPILLLSNPQRGYLISARIELENGRKLYNSYDILIDSSTIKDNRWVGLMLLGLLAGLLILMFRPFGFRAFLYGLDHNKALLLLVCIIGICFVILQRVGVIFGDNTTYNNYTKQ